MNKLSKVYLRGSMPLGKMKNCLFAILTITFGFLQANPNSKFEIQSIEKILNLNEFVFTGNYQFLMNPTAYCEPIRPFHGSGPDRQVDLIERVKLENLDNTSARSKTISYYNNTTGYTVPNLTPGSTYSMIVKGQGNNKHTAVVWIDFNNDETFQATEKVGSMTQSSSGEFTFNITIPSTATTGQRRMRVLWQYNAYADNYYDDKPCTVHGWGQTEDYSVNIEGAGACNSTPEAGSITVNPTSGVPGSAYTVSASGYTLPATGINYKWQSNTNGIGWVDATSYSSTYSNFNGIAPALYTTISYKLVVRCFENGTDESNVVTFTSAYCTPSGGNGNASDAITKFSLSNLNNDPQSPVMGTNGYTDFTSLPPANLNIGQNYTANLTAKGGGLHTANIWIDYNNNGVFETTERVTTVNGYPNNTTYPNGIDLTTPSFTVSNYPGIHRMRVQWVYNADGNPNNLNPCSLISPWGETEDYMVNITESYCTPTYTNGCSSGPIISNVTTTGGDTNFSNNSDCSGGYINYFDTVGMSAKQDNSFNISTSVQTTFAYIKVWIDFNQDGDFDDTDEKVAEFSVTAGTSSNRNISIPINATIGETRMRVRASRDSNFTPCDNQNYGETEDYKITIILNPNCNGTPIGGTTVLNPNSGAPSSTVNGSVSGSTQADGITYQWQYSDDGTNWFDISGQTSATLTTTAIPTFGTRQYRRKITCTLSGLSAYSTPATYTTTFCTPSTNGANAYYITNFTTTGGVTNINNPSGGSASGYTNFSHISMSAYPNTTINYSINASIPVQATTYGRAIWVDWNENGIFEATEQVASSTAYSSPPLVGSFTVPSGASAGNKRMRILASWSPPNPSNPCVNSSLGEYEDYTLEVLLPCNTDILTVTDGITWCAGTVNLQASGNSNTTSYKWYDSASGGNLLTTTATGSWTTPSISTTTVYYVAAANEDCENPNRKAVTATVTSSPSAITINRNDSPNGANDCTLDYAQLTANGGEIADVYAYSEKFNSPYWSMNNSTNTDLIPYSSSTNYADGTAPEGGIQNNTSINTSGNWYYYPLNGNGNPLTVDVSSFSTLNFTFRHAASVSNSNTLNLNFYVEVSADGTNWYSVWEKLDADITGSISKEKWTLDLFYSPVLNYSSATNLQFRFRFSGDSEALNFWYLDDVEIYGNRKDVTWAPIAGLFIDPALSIPYNGEKLNTVYASPNGEQTYTATAFADGSCATSAQTTVIKNQKIFDSGDTLWNIATNWKPHGVPTNQSCVKIPSGRNVVVDISTAKAKNLTLEAGGKLTIQANQALTVTDFIQNNATVDDFVMESGASLVQVNDVLTQNNSTPITFKRNFIFSTERKQYNFIISPLIGQTIKTIYTNPPFVIYHKESANWFYNAYNGNYIAGRGLSIKEPTTNSISNSNIDAVMKGIPQNGIINFPLTYTPNPSDPVFIPGYNLTGNPYPSTIDIKALYDANSGKIEPNFDFWDNRGNTIYHQQGSQYGTATINNYATYNAASDIGTAAISASGTAKIPTRYVRPGTAFMIRAKETANGQTLDFNNSYRKVITNGIPEFFGKSNNFEMQDDRYWLTLQTPDNLEVMTAVVYFQNGNDEFDIDDTKAPGASNELYSLIGEEQVIIQGKAPFNTLDKVPLGMRLFELGTYTLTLYNKEGVFANGQNIYLYDKKLNKIHNLSSENYTFDSAEGEYNHRFEIIYTLMTFQQSDAVIYAKGIKIEKKDGNLVVNSSNEKLTRVEIFELNGRSAFQKSDINSLDFTTSLNQFNKGIVFVLVETESGEISTKKLVNQ